jgi:hypothetical protein
MKIARMIYTQLKVVLINYDANKTLKLSSEDLTKFFKNVANFTENNIQLVFRRGGLGKDRKYSYEEATKFVLSEHVMKVFSEINLNDTTKLLSIENFVKVFEKICGIVPCTPLSQKFEDLYKSRVSRLGNFDYNECQSLALHIFSNYPSRQ